MLAVASAAPHVLGDSMDSSAIETIRDLFNKCLDRLDWLCSTGLYQLEAWQGELERLRLWGQNLDPAATTARSPTTLLEDALAHSLPLQNALLEAIEGLYTGLKAFADAINRSSNKNSFKIAGIDVLSTGGSAPHDPPSYPQAASKYDDVMRRLNNTSRDITNLYNIFDVPSRPNSGQRHFSRHSSQRSMSRHDSELYHDSFDASSDISPSPMAPPSRSRRARGDSQSSRDESVYSSSTTYRFSSGSSERMTQELPSIHSLPSNDGFEQSPYDAHSGAAPRAGPYYGPSSGLQSHPQHTSVYPIPPKSPYVNFTPSRSLHDVRSHESLSDYRDHDQLGSLSPSSDRAVRGSASRSLNRLRMPLDPADDSNSAPKLTKTGRVSKALRGEPVHACNVCDKVYTRAEHLRRHRTSHRLSLTESARSYEG